MHFKQERPPSLSTPPPNYYSSGPEEDYSTSLNPPMKYKERHDSTAESLFDVSPMSFPVPYYGMFGVSDQHSARSVSASSPSIHHQSPLVNSPGSLSTVSHGSDNQTRSPDPSSYRNQNQALINIAPNPQQRQPPRSYNSRRRQDSEQSDQSTLGSQSAPDHSAPKFEAPKSKKKGRKDIKGLILSGAMTDDERLLLDLCDRGLSWAQILEEYFQVTGQRPSTATLQMRKMRLVEKLRQWSLVDVSTQSQHTQKPHSRREIDKN